MMTGLKKAKQPAAPAGKRAGNTFRASARWLLLAALAAAIATTVIPGLAVIWRPSPASPFPEGLTGQALVDHLNSLDEAGVAAIETNALARLKQDSLDPTALQYLAIVAGLRKQTERQEALILNAARFSMRDPRTQLSAVNIAMMRGRIDDALYQLDGLLRARPELGAQFFADVAKLIDAPDTLAPLAKKLASRPPWRKAFIDDLLAQPGGWQRVQTLLGAMRSQGEEPDANELRQLISLLVKQKNHEQAYFVWLDSLNQAGLGRVLGVYDGGFDMEAQNQFFDWNLRKSKNVSISIVARPGSSVNRALRLEFVGHQGFFTGVSQYLRLAPGQHAFRFSTLVQSLEASRGLVWRFRCVDGNTVLAQSPEIKIAGPWTSTNTLVDVPASGCSTQLLQLETYARSGLDTKLTGLIYIDDITIEPVSGQVPAQEGN